MRSCVSSGVSRYMQALIRSSALASVRAHVYACVPKDNSAPSLPCFLQSSPNEEPRHHCGNQGQA